MYLDAAMLYESALEFTPDVGPIHAAATRMFAKGGDFDRARMHYDRAQTLMPENDDFALKIADLDHRDEGEHARHDTSPSPVMDAKVVSAAPDPVGTDRTYSPSGADEPTEAGLSDWIVRELLPRSDVTEAPVAQEALSVVHPAGRSEHTRWGILNVLRGVEAIRGHCLSIASVREVRVSLDGTVVHVGPPTECPRKGGPLHGYVFNVWVDLTGFAPGPYEMEVRCVDARGLHRIHSETVAIAEPRSETAYPNSDGVVEIDRDDPRSVAEQVNARPSMIRRAGRPLLDRPLRSVLVQRIDQLGDLAISVPAIRHLKAMWPQAQLVGLLSPANADLGRSLGLFDAVVVADCPIDPTLGKRVMAADAQDTLRASLAEYDFDVAIDLGLNADSRPLLRLSGASFLYGFGAADAPWLSAEMVGGVLDPVNGQESASHASRLVGLIAWLGGIVADSGRTIGSKDRDDGSARRRGLDDGRKYVLLDLAANPAFGCWPGFEALAALILKRLELDVVVMASESTAAPDGMREVAGASRLHGIARPTDARALDEIVTSAEVVIGDASEVTQLAALRATPTIGLHLATCNWNARTQSGGLLVSRRVPCAGCGIRTSTECGQGLACLTHIDAQGVFQALVGLLNERR